MDVRYSRTTEKESCLVHQAVAFGVGLQNFIRAVLGHDEIVKLVVLVGGVDIEGVFLVCLVKGAIGPEVIRSLYLVLDSHVFALTCGRPFPGIHRIGCSRSCQADCRVRIVCTCCWS